MLLEKKHKISLGIIFSIIFVLILLINVYTPYWGDDFVYMCQIENKDGDVFGEPISNVWQIFESQYHHYFTHNGRSVVHGIVQLFMLMPKMVFNICNALMFCVLVLISTFFVCYKNNISANIIIPIALLLFLLLWHFMPHASMTMAWMTGSVNYLWALVGVLLYVVLFNKALANNLHYVWLYAICAFFLGWGHEGISVGIAGATVLYMLFKRKELNCQVLIIGIAFCLGSILLVLSPGIYHRGISGDKQFSFMVDVVSTLRTMILGGNLPIFTILFATELVGVLIKPKYFCDFVQENLFFHLSIFVWIMFCLATQFVGGVRGAIGLEIVSIILLLRLCFPMLYRYRKWISVLIILAIIYTFYDYSTILSSCKKRDKEITNLIESWNQTPQGEYTSNPLTIPKNGRMIYSGVSIGNENNWNQYLFCKHYGNKIETFGIGAMKAIPADAYDIIYGIKEIEDANVVQMYDSLYYVSNTEYDMLILPNEYKKKDATIHIYFTKDRKGLTKIIASLLRKSNTGQYIATGSVISKNNKKYLLFERYDKAYSYLVPITNITIL